MKRLLFLMKQEGITSQYQLSKHINVGYSTVNTWFKQGKIPNEHNLKRLCEFFNVSPAWLLYGEEKYSPTLSDRVARMAMKLEKYLLQYPEEFDRINNLVDVYIRPLGGVHEGGKRSFDQAVHDFRRKAEKQRKKAG